jgi:hypothetical protein
MGTFNVDPDARYKVLPKGEYSVMVLKVEQKAPKQGEFDYLEASMEIIEGEYKGEIMMDRLSLSPKAAPRLAGFIHACGLADPSMKGTQSFDTNDLLNKVLVVKGEPETFKGFEKFRPTSFKMHPDIARTSEGATQEAEPAREQAPAPAPAPSRPAPQARSSAPARRPI